MDLPAPQSRSQRIGIALALLVLTVLVILVVSGAVSVSLQLMGPAGETPPQGSFHVSDGNSVTITRDVGPSVNASNLQVRVNDTARGTWKELANGTSTVSLGDSITIERVDSGDVVSLYWIGNNVSQRLVRKGV